MIVIDEKFLVIKEINGYLVIMILINSFRSGKEPWIIYANSSNKTMLSEKFNYAKLYLDDDVLLATNDKNNNNTIVLWEMYKIGSTYPLEVLHFGFWDVTTGLSTTKLGKWVRRGNLQVKGKKQR
jgi:hypothetical protein